ncbi:hypothetical protein [Aquibium sp. ELW1220]|uniref:hypothetical protein n=1 Tax=Aquibium sp. ELW1220 TaxID=2976766 RepID=UPI0025AF40CA|nr:hypothetical protein [Aquibium sp. ELW1220]MDN2584277.1 hypothetical protein [Aquibium sp. ELW1220]
MKLNFVIYPSAPRLGHSAQGLDLMRAKTRPALLGAIVSPHWQAEKEPIWKYADSHSAIGAAVAIWLDLQAPQSDDSLRQWGAL